ncbi:hypothetical protein [Thermogemmatispora tikiterensis]|uniref:Uncharacterized protein n=1 Tax=Thermogemmatispora tikiterensis TaxID=1825093 RepID=A0A328VKW0_9CHLR|nr:hypothetical protein [Thermogemmatispora tikiterensis]RAQ97779.1 hypothetical protein A4R35_19725 [Thermogemmatispora tikiterensis]
MHDERNDRNTGARGSNGGAYGGGIYSSGAYGTYGSYGADGGLTARPNAIPDISPGYPGGTGAAGTPYLPSYYPPYGVGQERRTGWETMPMPAAGSAWQQPLYSRSMPGAEKLTPPARKPSATRAAGAGAASSKKRASMPKEQAQRLAQRLKRWAVALAVAGFGTFSALVAFHQASASASASQTNVNSSSSSGSQSQVNTPSSGNSSSSSSSSSTNANSNGASSSSSGSSAQSSSSTGSSSSQDSNGFFNQQGGDNFGSQPTFGQGHSGSGVS